MTQGVPRITPAGLTAAEPGTLLASRTAARSFIATLLRLALLVGFFLTVALSRFVLPALVILLSWVCGHPDPWEPRFAILAIASQSWRPLRDRSEASRREPMRCAYKWGAHAVP